MNSGLRISSTAFEGIRATICSPGRPTPESFLKPAEKTPSSSAVTSIPMCREDNCSFNGSSGSSTWYLSGRMAPTAGKHAAETSVGNSLGYTDSPELALQTWRAGAWLKRFK